MKKLRVGVLFGGRSAEHEVSISSARNVFKAIDKEKYEVVPVFIDKQGDWIVSSLSVILNSFQDLDNSKKEMLNQVQHDNIFEFLKKVDVIFPVLHGTYGEDGTMQGLLKLANIPFVGASVLGSAVGMDKDVMKRLLRDAGIPIAKFLVFRKNSQNSVISTERRNPHGISHSVRDDKLQFEQITKELGLPFFVKPANLGSSVGVSKVHDESEFEQAVSLAFQYDSKIIIEEFIEGDEVFCAVLGNDKIMTSIPGMLHTEHEFYDYNAKYVDEIEMRIPAPVSESVIKQIQELSKKAVQVLCCEGMARVDIFVTKENKLILNEINTIPGFTEHSWYPKLWEASGVTQNELIDRLIQLAIERFEKENSLKTNYV